MQLTRKQRRRLRKTLLASSCALLGVMPSAMADKGDWTFDTSALFYSEVGGILVLEPMILAKQDRGDDSYLTLNIVGDVLTGPTPTGGMPSSKSQTVTGPSGKKTTAIAPGQTPVNKYFKDTRGAVKATWSQPLGDLWRLDWGGGVSLEDDFKSLAANALLARSFNEQNTTLSGGLSYEYDSINPIGGVPQPLSVVPAAGGTSPVAHSRSKNIKGVLIGVTQVMNQNWLVQMNFSYGASSGYLNNYYKQVSVIASQATAQTALGDPLYQIYENRPSTRSQRTIYLRNKVYLDGNVLDISYRYGWDTWGIRSNTLGLRYRWALSDHFFLEPQLRYYRQSAAYFYRRGLLNSEPLPAFVSADYRLDAFTGRTIGLEFGTHVSKGSWWPAGTLTLRLEHYTQTGGSDPQVNIGVQQNFSLFPGLSANIVQVDYSFGF